ncbi:type II secretion system protein GspG [Flavobacterium sp.]|uniref:type II secretion system protein GspG n=1 Tax=Flavobacterium sp. TaxID=239 RepID=UPI0026033B26|nr:type II secretion system protein GspG [Flavobacterium sp.]
MLLICLIPLIGAFVGLGLIILGYDKLKNKNLIRIGIFGIIATIISYSTFYFITRKIDNNDKQIIELTNKTLSKLKLLIEGYKVEYGIYPKDLESLSKVNETIMINDPILLFKMDNSIETTFEYVTDGNTFKIFSVGVDGIANTKDDIYPKK